MVRNRPALTDMSPDVEVLIPTNGEMAQITTLMALQRPRDG